MKNRLLYTAFVLTAMIGGISASHAQRATENVVIVTLDGMRWQELFGGADRALLQNKQFTKDSNGTHKRFWAEDLEERRKKLFPFIWTEIAAKGQIYGNRRYDNKVNNANKYQFSYPGYNEIFTGYPDTAVNSNDKIRNKNTNVLEYLNNQPGFEGKIAAFSTWDVFPYILNKWRSGIYVNADDTLSFPDEKLQLLNDMQFLTTRPIGVRPDILTYMSAREYLKAYRPRVLYIAFDETDDFAHGGEYDQYLGSAYAEDRMIADLWKYLQSTPGYKDKTTLIITCDHGRGDKDKNNWRHHGERIPEAGQIWIAAIGPDTKAMGEAKTGGQLYQEQLAATIAGLLGHEFRAEHPVAKPITAIYK
ncbi:alkaline phosphatase family protein [Sediminibacterium soli]|uniref:alkaline phosphatase family protein n=1 Tax=Sediminibacterium soli TaxID=2698829 RepID=UPI00137996AF|nr:alkaline phosphatase family protein [Sediminibacterium soli]NCI46285.1 alkaline phosphatase family protein [Sediminibacterium soli]